LVLLKHLSPPFNMFAATRRWFRRNRTPIAIGVGVVGAGYVVTQYILNKINDARERMSSDRIAKEKCVQLPVWTQNRELHKD
jgi:hypothetical protein